MQQTDLSGWTLVFDLDGTLVDSAPDLHASLNHCLELHRLKPVPFEAVRTMIGQGARAMIEKGLAWNKADNDGHDVDTLWRAFLEHYTANICHLSRPYPDAETVIEASIRAGAICAVCTNKTQALAEKVLEGLALSGHFAAICGADRVARKKPDGDHIRQTVRAAGGSMTRSIMIGDSQTDERAARDAGLPFIFVTFGYGPAPDDTGPVLASANSFKAVSEAINHIAA